MEKFIVEDVNRRTSTLTTIQPNPAQKRSSTLRHFDNINTQSPIPLLHPTGNNPSINNPPINNPTSVDTPHRFTDESQDDNVVNSATAKRVFENARLGSRVLELGIRGRI